MKSLLLPIAGAALLSSAAFAQAPGGGARGGLGQKDQTRVEAQQRADRLFQLLDANKDGTVTKAEVQQVLAQFQQMGGDEDNGSRRVERMERMIDQAFGTAQSVTLQQFEAQVLARFDAADLNHDGVLTAAEREQARAAMKAAQPATATPQ